MLSICRRCRLLEHLPLHTPRGSFEASCPLFQLQKAWGTAARTWTSSPTSCSHPSLRRSREHRPSRLSRKRGRAGQMGLPSPGSVAAWALWYCPPAQGPALRVTTWVGFSWNRRGREGVGGAAGCGQRSGLSGCKGRWGQRSKLPSFPQIFNPTDHH